MSLLAPLFFIGALAISLPVLFHLIRREPKDSLKFSSLLFLTSSPPRISKRSRIEHWLLLLLRAFALLMIALAFTRPFWRTEQQVAPGQLTHFKLVLLDTSASMQRDDLWEQSSALLRHELNSQEPNLQVALLTFDRQIQIVRGFNEANTAASQDVDGIIASLQPTWFAGDLGNALIFAAEFLEEQAIASGATSAQQSLIVISDFGRGNSLNALQNYPWPAQTKVVPRIVTSSRITNADVQVGLKDSARDDDPLRSPRESIVSSEQSASLYTARVRNSDKSQRSEFQVVWRDMAGQPLGSPLLAVVPPGAVRRIDLPMPPQGAVAVELRGDDSAFDNTYYVAVPQTKRQQIWFVGERNEDPRSDLFYFLEKVDLNSSTREIVVRHLQPNDLANELTPMASSFELPLLIVNTIVPANAIAMLRTYATKGGRVLMVLDENLANQQPVSLLLQELLNEPQIQVVGSATDDYALLSRIDFANPLFQPFSDPRFSDFSKIQFWRHAKVDVPSQLLDSRDQSGRTIWSIPAWFDDRSPAIVQKQEAAGQWFVLTAGWQPNESQLALSSKFVPLLAALAVRDLADENSNAHWLGQTLPEVPPSAAVLRTPLGINYDIAAQPATQSTKPVEPLQARLQNAWDLIREPGLYRVGNASSSQDASGEPAANKLEEELIFAMNVAQEEYLSEPLDVSALEQFGVTLKDAQRELRQQELAVKQQDLAIEQSQQWWKILLVMSLGLIGLETWLSGRKAPLNPQSN
jgi:hypothetical protein